MADWDGQLDTATPEALVQMGHFTQEEADRIHEVWDIPWGDRTQADHDLTNKYLTYAGETTWEETVREYRARLVQDMDPDRSTYDADTEYAQPTSGEQDPSTVPTTVGDLPAIPSEDTLAPGNRDALTVNTAALTLFGNNMNTLKTLLDTSRGYIDDVNIAPGNFGYGFQLAIRINNEDGGLKGDVSNFMRGLSNALQDVQDDIKTVVRDYETVEELNNITGEQLNTVFREPWAGINNLTDWGNTTSGTVGSGNSDEDED